MVRTVLIAILFSASFLVTNATTYYVSREGADNNPGVTQQAPWSFARLQKELARKKDNLIKPGDAVLLKRGAVFYGTLTFGCSGTAENPIILGAYGTGAKPVITGFATINKWNSLGGGMYESSQPVSSLQSCNMLTINGKEFGQGRYPNENTPNKGYLTIDDSGADSTTITDAALSTTTTDWTGARAVVRIAHYILDTATILQHKGTTITTKRLYHQPPKGYGYFITNDPRTVDKHGEWYYNAATGKLRIRLDGAPASYTIRMAVQDTLINCSNRDYITVQDLRLEGANKFGTFHRSSANNTVQRCEIVWCGDEGISAAQADNINLTALDNFISDCGDYGIMVRFVKGGLNIQRNTIRRIGLLEQNGGYGTICRIGISNATGKGHEIAFNKVDSTGFTGIRFSGSDVKVHHNFVQNYCFIMDDSGGIHTGNAAQGKHANRKVWSNIVLNGIGAPAGTGGVNQACAYYIDDAAHDVELWNNVAAFGGDAGIYVHNAWNINVHDNLVYDFKDAAAQIVYDRKKWGVPYSISFTRNTLIASDPKGWLLKFLDLRDSAFMHTVAMPQNGQADGFEKAIDYNRYARPLNESDARVFVGWYIYQRPKEQKRYYTIKQFTERFGFDAHSTGSEYYYPQTQNAQDNFKFIYNATLKDSAVNLQGAWVSVDGKSYKSGTVTLPPFSAMVLLKANGAMKKN